MSPSPEEKLFLMLLPAWQAEAGLSRYSYALLPPHRRPRTRRLGRNVEVVLEPVATWQARQLEAAK